MCFVYSDTVRGRDVEYLNGGDYSYERKNHSETKIDVVSKSSPSNSKIQHINTENHPIIPFNKEILQNAMIESENSQYMIRNKTITNVSSRVDWRNVIDSLSEGDAISAFTQVIDRGELTDLSKLMQAVGPKPYVSTLM